MSPGSVFVASNFRKYFFSILSCVSGLIILSCTTFEQGPLSRPLFDAPPLSPDPNQKFSETSKQIERQLSSTGTLITYCTKETAAASNPEEKKWREAFSLEVMERICNQEPEVAKPWRSSTYLESSWAYGLDLTGVDNGVPRGTAITSRHVIYTKHYGFHGQVGQTIWEEFRNRAAAELLFLD